MPDRPQTQDDIARLVNAERVRQNLSIRMAAKVAGVPPGTVQGWLSGKHVPTPALRPNFERLVAALGLRDRIHLDWADLGDALTTLRESTPPYVGLRPFAVADASHFFGREEESARVARAVLDHDGRPGIVAVVGPSGGGKSSLLAAGVVGRECGSGGVLEGSTGLVLAATDLPAHVPPTADFVVIDQLEEALDTPAHLESTVASVMDLARDHTVVLGIRSDAFGELAEQPALRDALEHPILLAPMSRAGAVAAIEKPAAQCGVTVEPGLATLMISDLAAGEPLRGVPAGVLPLLSNALLMTWSVGQGQRMTIADYEATGGLGSAIEALAEGVVRSLAADEATQVRPLFLKLVRTSESGVTRARLPLGTLSDAEREIVEAFIQARILTATAEYVQISHESLFRHWPRLADWFEQARENLRVRDHLERATHLWLDSGRAPESLLPVDRLPLFIRFLEDPVAEAILGTNEREFLTASREHFTTQLDAERLRSTRLRRRGRISVMLAALASGLALVAGLAVVQTRGLQLEAQSRQVASQANSLRSRDPNLEAQMALVSDGITRTREGLSAVLDATSIDTPTRWPGTGPARLAVDPSGTRVARGDNTGQVTLWDASTLTNSPGLTFLADPQGDPLSALALADREGRHLLGLGGAGGYRAIWDVSATPTKLADWSDGEATASAVAFDESGETLAVGLDDGTLDLFSLADPTDPARRARLSLSGPVTSLAFDPLRPRLFVGGADDALGVVDLSTPQPDHLDFWPHTPGRRAHCLSLAVSPDGRRLVAGLTSTVLARWDLTAPTPTSELIEGFVNWVDAVAFSPDSATLAAGDIIQKVRLLDAATMTEQRILDGPSPITGVGFIGGAPVATSNDGTLWAWPDRTRVLRSGGGTVFQLITDRTSRRWLAAPSPADQDITVWRLDDGVQPAFDVPAPPGIRLSSSAAFSADGDTLYAGTRNGEVISWPIGDSGPGTPRVQAIFPATRAADISNVVLSPTAPVLVTPDYAAETTIVSRIADDGTITPVATLQTPTSQVATFNADGSLLQIGTDLGVQLYDLSVPEHPVLVSTIPTDTLATASWFAPRSPLLASGSDSGLVTIWDISNPKAPVEVRRFADARSGIYAVTFSPDEKTLIAAGGDEVFFGWDVTSPRTDATFILAPQMGRTTETRFILDGTAFVGAGDDGGVRLWTLDPTAAEAALCRLRGSPLTPDEWARFLPGITPFDPC